MFSLFFDYAVTSCKNPGLLSLALPLAVMEYEYGFVFVFLSTYPSLKSLFINLEVCSLERCDAIWMSRDVISLSVINPKT